MPLAIIMNTNETTKPTQVCSSALDEGLCIGAIYSHNKTGNLYQLNGAVKDCTNSTEGRTMALYKGLNSNLVFVREISEFSEKFTMETTTITNELSYTRELLATVNNYFDLCIDIY